MNAQRISARINLLPEAPPYDSGTISRHGIRGLQCGSGLNLASGWLNTDSMHLVDPSGATTLPHRLTGIGSAYYMECDNAAQFPISDSTFDWIYSEHFIEHVDLPAAVEWFREMRRLLKVGGVLRVSTPDLRRYLRAYLEPSNGFFLKHRENLLEMGMKQVPERPAWMINQLFMRWGHRWIYDLDEITMVAVAAGFSKETITERRFHEGAVSEVSRLDRLVRSDESLYIEAIRT